MNISITKEEVLHFKCSLNKIVKNKTEAVAAKNWEAAAGFRDEEKVINEYLQTLKNKISKELTNFEQISEKKEDYFLLQELLIEL